MLLQYESFHTVFSAPESMKKRLRHCIKGRIPKVDAVRDALGTVRPREAEEIFDSTVGKVYQNAVLRGGTIGGYVTAAVDGVELYSSMKKPCKDCLTRKGASGKKEYFHRSVVCATVGDNPHLILGQEMLHPRDGGETDEGELTGGKRLVKKLYGKYGHFADVLVADGLYLNAPFLKTVQGCHMEAVVRLKDERRQIFRDAEDLFEKGEGRRKGFQRGKRRIECWDLAGFEMEGMEKKVRVVRYCEHIKLKAGREEEKWMWLVTTSEEIPREVLWKMMHKRWDIEENAFHQLKTYYHAGHCYCHKGLEVIFYLTLTAFNIRELYLYRRMHSFESSGITRKSVTRRWRDDLQSEDYRELLYKETG